MNLESMVTNMRCYYCKNEADIGSKLCANCAKSEQKMRNESIEDNKAKINKQIDDIGFKLSNIISKINYSALEEYGYKIDYIDLASLCATRAINRIEENLNSKDLSLFETGSIVYGIKSILQGAILNDIVDMLTKAIETFNKYIEKLNSIVSTKNEKSNPIDPIKKMFLKAKFFLLDDKSDYLSFTESEIEECNKLLDEYNLICNSIENYSIVQNIIPSFIKEFKQQYISHTFGFSVAHPDYIKQIMTVSEEPKLRKLGLDCLIPVLENELSRAYLEYVQSKLKRQLTDDEFNLFYINFDNKNDISNTEIQSISIDLPHAELSKFDESIIKTPKDDSIKINR